MARSLEWDPESVVFVASSGARSASWRGDDDWRPQQDIALEAVAAVTVEDLREVLLIASRSLENIERPDIARFSDRKIELATCRELPADFRILTPRSVRNRHGALSKSFSREYY